MAIDMSNVTSLYNKDNNVKLYKQVFSIKNDEALHDINGDPISLLYTVYSTSQVQWTGTTTNSADFYNFLISCGYNTTSSAIRIGFDNQKYVYYTYNGVDYPIQSSDCSSNSRTYFSIYIYDGGFPKVPECSITGSGWTEVIFPEESSFVVKQDEYESVSSTMTFLAVGNDLNGDYIKQYFIGTTAYPDVTITSFDASTYTYTLSDGNSYSIRGNKRFEVNTLTQYKEISSILDITGNILWEKANAYGYYIKIGDYYIDHSGGNSVVARSTTPSTVWHLEEDNRIYCLIEGTKRYLYSGTSGGFYVHDAPSLPNPSDYTWLYKNRNSITATINGTKYYLYRYSSTSVRMQTTATTLTFESNDPRTHTPDWHTIWEGDYSITCEAINGQIVSAPESNRVIYHISPKVSSIATDYSNMKIKVYYQFEWIGDRGTSTPANTYLTEYTVSNLSSNKTILNLPVTPTDSTLSLTDYIASGVSWNATTGNISFETRGYLKPEDKEYLKTTIRITKIELYC